MVKEAVQDYAATAAGAAHERIEDIISPPVLPVVKDPRFVGEDGYQLNYDGANGSGELDWPASPTESTTPDPTHATEEISEDVDRELARQPTKSKWDLGKIAVARWLLGRSDRSSGELGVRQEVATQRGSSASFTGESTRRAHNKREGARMRVSKLTRRREEVERKKWAVENSSLAYGDKRLNHRKAMRHRIDAAQARAAADRLARGVQLTPSNPNKTSEISVEAPLVINREHLDPETEEIYWTSESPPPNNLKIEAERRDREQKGDDADRKSTPIFDTPADAIEAINNGGLSPFVRANEARQLNKWLRLHREDTDLHGELQDMAEGRDFGGRRIRRGIARRRDFAHRLLTSAGAEDAASEIPTSDGYQRRSQARTRRKDWRRKKVKDFKEGKLDTPKIDDLDLR